MTSLQVLSLGGGLQSSALAEMTVEGLLPRLDAVVFADTHGELPETYEHVDYLRGRLARVGTPLHVVSAGSLEADVHAASTGQRNRLPSMPTRIRTPAGELERVNAYHCSYDYKRRVVVAKVKQLCGPRGSWRRANVVQWIGYSTDEGSRVKQPDECRCGHRRVAHYAGSCHSRVNRDQPQRCARACPGYEPWQVNRFPLIELGMRRGDVARWLSDRGLPVPPRSACWFCPNRGNGHWRELRDQRPELWQRACALDEAVRPPSHGLRGERFLHQSGQPLALADLRSDAQRRDEDHGEAPLFDDDGAAAYDCAAGVCFT